MKRFITVSVILMLSCFNINARDNGNALSVISPDSLNVLLKSYLEMTSGKRFEDPKIPRFLISDRNDVFVFGIGGYVGAKMMYDYNGNGNAGFKPVDLNTSTRSNDVVNLDMTSSRFFFKVLGNTKKGIAEAYIEAAFNGNNKTLSLKKAYVNMLGFRVGISLTAFTDNQTIPVISDGGTISFNDRNVPMVAYSYLFKNGIRLQGGFEFPQSTTIYTSSDEGEGREVVTVGMPLSDLSLGAYYDKDRLHLHAGGIMRTLTYYDSMDTERFKNRIGCGFQLSGNYEFGSVNNCSHKLFVQAQYADKMPDCFSNIEKEGLTAILPFRSGAKAYDFTGAFGGQIGYRFACGPNSVNVQGSANTVFGHENSGCPELYKKGFVGTANYMRSFWKYGTIGGEVVFGRNYSVGGTVYSDFRIVALLRYDF